jgi:hypothetical protein
MIVMWNWNWLQARVNDGGDYVVKSCWFEMIHGEIGRGTVKVGFGLWC